MLNLKETTGKLALSLMLALCTAMLPTQSVYAQIPKLNSFTPAKATVYLDFDGQTVKGTAWNWDGPIKAQPSALSTRIITEVFNRIAEDFRIFNLNITTDSTVFKKAPTDKRMRVIFTPTSSWYGSVAGVSYINSFTWGDDTPAWVFSTLLEGNPKYIGEAASHEIGHTLGLQHQSVYDKNCNLVAEYAEGKGTGETGWAPIMGVGYYRNLSLWTLGPSIEGCHVMQNDITIISKGLNNIGLRTDDHSNSKLSATSVTFTGKNFVSTGIINSSTDRDFFKIVVAQRSRLKASVIPANVGAGNAGANLDVFLTLTNSSGDTIGRYNPKNILSSSLDTQLAAGTYYFGVDGVSNQYVSDYGVVGLYSLTGSLDNPPSKPAIMVKGDVKNDDHLIRWNIPEGTVPRVTYLEYSIDDKEYTSVPVAHASHIHRAPGSKNVYYRIRMVLPDSTEEYSNTIILNSASAQRVTLVTNIVSGFVQVKSAGDYAYQLFDETGRLLGRGRLSQGISSIPLTGVFRGIVVMKVFNQQEQFHFRLIKQ